MAVPHSLGETLPLWSILPFAGLLLAIAVGAVVCTTLVGAPLRQGECRARGPGSTLLSRRRPDASTAHAARVRRVHRSARRTLHHHRRDPRARRFPRRRWSTAFSSASAPPSPISSAPPAPACSSCARCCARSAPPAVAHVVVFFIFLVSNVGGSLTPLGDPPLFLGYLKGVPFFWTLHLWPQWLLPSSLVLVIFYVVDLLPRRPEPAQPQEEAGCAIDGKTICCCSAAWWRGLSPTPLARSAAWLLWAAVVSADAPEDSHARTASAFSRSSRWRPVHRHLHDDDPGVADPRGPRRRSASRAVAILLGHRRALELPRQCPDLSDLLAAARGSACPRKSPACPARSWPRSACGAVFMGANSYIGNGPNFMVKAIAEDAGRPDAELLRLHGVLGGVLLPVFAIVTVVFFR